MGDLKFGTSGLRGLVTDLQGGPAADWCLAFLRSPACEPAPGAARRLFVGRDLRRSSPALAADCLRAARLAGFEPVDCGALPTPALALASIRAGAPAVMVTGSHIPDSRNGLKFYRADGEISKADEAAIRAVYQPGAAVGAPDGAAAERFDAVAPYERRYLDAFGAGALRGLTLGIYQHSTVARDMLGRILESLGARCLPLGRSDRFVPVDTEAHRPEDVAAIAEWTRDGGFDAVVSADGDADRPLVADETGRILRGDVVGLLTARHLGAAAIATPVTSSSAIERLGIAPEVRRTRVGSPFVIAALGPAQGGSGPVVGFEANGGVLLGSDAALPEGRLAALPTRDAVLPIVCVLAECVRLGRPLSAVVRDLGAGHAAAHRLEEVDPAAMRDFVERLEGDASYRDAFFADVGPVAAVDALDGVRVTLAGGATVHYRASGNAPELRCYAEGADEAEARAHLEWGLASAERVLRGG